ncbi:Ammonium transporter [compost metagenome]
MFFDAVRGKKPSAVGFCIGVVVGLVAITPAAGFVTVPHALVIGVVASVISNVIAHLRTKTALDDTLDVFPCHGVGGMVGMILTGIFATSSVNEAVAEQGLFFGESALFLKHLLALVLTSVFSFGMSFVVLKITDTIIPLRVSHEDENVGLDISQHDEKLIEA